MHCFGGRSPVARSFLDRTTFPPASHISIVNTPEPVSCARSIVSDVCA